jgi:hypothetical protein
MKAQMTFTSSAAARATATGEVRRVSGENQGIAVLPAK